MVKLQTLAFLSLAATAMAAPSWWEQYSYQKVKTSAIGGFGESDKRLVQTSESEPPVWMSEAQRLQLLRNRVGFMDVTDHQDLGHFASTFSKSPLPAGAYHQKKFAKYVDSLSAADMEVNLKEFTSFNTRYYKSETGFQSAKWLYKQISDLIEETDGDSDISIRKFEHSWKQFSIIARFDGRDDSLSNEPVIIGAHQDSVNMWLPNWGRSPGADDDGSGTITTLEIFKALVSTGFRPQRPVEFHWYSAEEAGLLGSQDVAKSYAASGVKPIAMIQNDMTGYVGQKNPESYGVITDYVDDDLTELVRVYAREYGDIPVSNTKCGYACSDHGSWSKAGFRSAFVIEGPFDDSSPYIHSSNDDVSHIDFNHMKQFAKLSLGFAVELGNFRGVEEDGLLV